MSKPGEMVQLLRENYEEQLEAYRLLRNKFLAAVPGMNLDKEKLLYERLKSDLHMNSIIDFERRAEDAGTYLHDAIKAALADDPDWRRLCVDALARAEGRTA